MDELDWTMVRVVTGSYKPYQDQLYSPKKKLIISVQKIGNLKEMELKFEKDLQFSISRYSGRGTGAANPHMDATVNGQTAQTHRYFNRTISLLKLIISNSRMPRCLTATWDWSYRECLIFMFLA